MWEPWQPPGIPQPIRTGRDLARLLREIGRLVGVGRRYGIRELAEDLAAIGAPRPPSALRRDLHAKELRPHLSTALELLRARIAQEGRRPAETPRPPSLRSLRNRLRQRRPPHPASERLRRF